MSANIDTTNGKIAFTRRANTETPWWGEGQVTAENASMATWLQDSGSDYDVIAVNAQYRTPTGQFRTYKGSKILIRGDNFSALGTVSDHYKIHQRKEIAAFYADQMRKNNLELVTMGNLNGGKQFFVSAKMPDSFIAKIGGDHLKPYMVIVTGFTGKDSTRLYFTHVRPVCENTVNMGLSSEAGKIFRQHHGNIFNAELLEQGIEAAHLEMSERSRVFNDLAKRNVSPEFAAGFYADMLGINVNELGKTDKDGKKLVSTKSANMLDILKAAYVNAPGAVPGTAWGILQGITYAVDHKFSVRDTDSDGKLIARINSSQFGNGAKMKSKALEMLAAAVNVELVQQAA